MKFIVIFTIGVLIANVESIRTYTTPSPYGSYRLKQIKCTCTDDIYDYLQRNFSCFAKAVNRDVTTANAYAMLKKQIDKAWIKPIVEYKYGTIYRPIIEFQKVEGCELLKRMSTAVNPAVKVLYKYIVMLSDEYDTIKRVLKDGCPFKVGEELFAYNLTVDTKYIPSVFNQGDYRATIRVFMTDIDNLVCNNTIIASVISPFKESFGRK